MDTQKTLNDFIAMIMKESGLDNMPADFLEEYRMKLSQEAQKHLGLAAIKELSDEEIVEFNSLIESGQADEEAAANYLAGHIDDYQDKMARALSEFGQLVIEKARSVK